MIHINSLWENYHPQVGSRVFLQLTTNGNVWKLVNDCLVLFNSNGRVCAVLEPWAKCGFTTTHWFGAQVMAMVFGTQALYSKCIIFKKGNILSTFTWTVWRWFEENTTAFVQEESAFPSRQCKVADVGSRFSGIGLQLAPSSPKFYGVNPQWLFLVQIFEGNGSAEPDDIA